MEHQEAEDERLRNRELMKFIQMQADEKAQKMEHEFVKEQKAATKAQALLDQ